MKGVNSLSFVISVFIIFHIRKLQGQEVISIRVDQSNVKGVVEGRGGQREYYAFKGIQYANASRWKDPVLFELLTDEEYDATKFGSICSQWIKSESGGKVIGLENCLFLNIFTKILPDTIGRENLNPVMVYIHGGGFISGSAEIAGPRRFMTADEKVVLVTINYRLGVLGFLSTGERDLAGNWGSLDQLTALEWVQKYIKYFGGDPTCVTIFGHSAGGAAVHLLTLSPRAVGKFQKAIMHSGNGLSASNIERHPLEYAHKISIALSCPTKSNSDMISCLHNESSEAIVTAQESLLYLWIYPKHAVPVIDGKARGALAFLPDDPVNLIVSGKFSPVPMITGITLDEGFLGYATIHNLFGNDKFRNTTFFMSEILPQTLRALLKYEKNENINYLSDLVVSNYFNNLNMTDETSFKSVITEMTEMIGDILYYASQRNFLEKYSNLNRNTIYSYVFTHKTINSPRISAKLIDSLRKQNVYHHLFDFGVPHVEDMFYLFDPVDFAPGTRTQLLSSIDERVAIYYTKILIAFAKDGTPAGGLDSTKAIWRPIKQGTLNYFNITSIQSLMGLDFRKREALFWLRTVPYLQQLENKKASLEEVLQETEYDLHVFQILFWAALVLAFVLFLAVIGQGYMLWRKRTTGKAALE